ncbi:hypothetical protein [Gracilinema caldarium]|uniref:hypothetical protein n=1 Tax=Gracilinema caldarium TaxID=215591 RepID=UPI0026F132A3|nr:hypothetical protein [Gracilinema caldarium]
MKRLLCIGVSILLISACSKGAHEAQQPDALPPSAVKEEQVARPTFKDKTDPSWNSYSIALPTAAIRLSELSRAFQSDGALSVKSAVGNRAFMSTYRYSVEGSKKIIARSLDESMITEKVLPDPAQLPVGDPKAIWTAPFTITAGPYLCTNAVILATSEPAIVILEPETLVPIKSFPISHLIISFMKFNPETYELYAIHGDLSTGTYHFGDTETVRSDTVQLLVGPEENALRKIQDKTGKLLSSSTPIQFGRTQIFPIVSEVETTAANLFRIAVEEDGPYRIYLDGLGNIPFLFILFDKDGESIFSNIEYAVEKVMEYPLEKSKVYYLAVSLFAGNSEGQNTVKGPVQLVIKKK